MILKSSDSQTNVVRLWEHRSYDKTMENLRADCDFEPHDDRVSRLRMKFGFYQYGRLRQRLSNNQRIRN